MLIRTNEVDALIVNLKPDLLITQEWSFISEQINCVFLCNNEIQLDTWRKYASSYSIFIKKDGIFLNRDIQQALAHLNLPSFKVAYVVLDASELKVAVRQELGTILVTTNTSITKEYLGYLPDIIVYRVSDIIKAIEHKSGFFAEVLATKLSNDKLYSSSHFVLPLFADAVSLITCGRYFGKEHPNSEIHQLSRRLLRSKDDDTQNHILVDILSYELKWIEQNLGTVDGVTRVPARPNNPDRLGKVVASSSDATKIPNYNDCLICVEDFPKQKNFKTLDERTLNVKGKFKVNSVINYKHIVIVDDIYTTGATLRECYSELRNHGASKVTAIVFAVNQLSPIFTNKEPINCSNCKSDLKLRLRKDGTAMFFGCNGFPDCTYAIDFEEGWNKFNEINQIKVDMQDFDIRF